MKNPTKNEKTIDSYDYLSKAASATDCTGLIPSLPEEEEELEAYEDLYPFIPPVMPPQEK